MNTLINESMNVNTLSESVLIGLDVLEDEPHLLFLGASLPEVVAVDPEAGKTSNKMSCM